MRYDDIIQSLQGLCAITTLFSHCRGCARYDDIIQSLQGLCALQRHSSAIVSCYEGTFQPSLVPMTVPVPVIKDILQSLQ